MSAVQQMLLACGGGAGAACDPYFAYVKFLLHCDGSNGSTTFVDNSSYARTVVAYQNAQVTTTNPKFGSGSALLGSNWPVANDQIQVPQTSGDLQPYTQDFTYELWVKASAINSQGMFGGLWTAGGGGGSVFFFGSYLGDIVFYDGTTFICQAASPNLATSWNHVAVTRQGTTFRVFVNGTLLTSGTSSVNLSSGGTGNTRTFDIGTFGGNTGLNGQVDDIRYTLGIARYTANFTPPTEAFPDNACALTPHLYWRVKNPDAGYYGTLELELRTVATGNTTISATNTGGTPISGGYYNRSGSDLNPGNAFNGTFAAPRFSSDAIVNGGDAWVGYQFPSAVIIREVALAGSGVSGQDFGGAVTVDWSDNGVSWTTAKVLSVSGLSSSAFVCYSVP